jgi:hypothetical protein
MTKQHMWLLIGGAVVGYLLAGTLVKYQPWKGASGLVSNF